MEPFALAPSHIVMRNQGQGELGLRTSAEVRELRPMAKRDYADEPDNLEEQEVHDRFGVNTNSATATVPTDHSLSGLTWNEHDLSAAIVGQNLWYIPSSLTTHYASRVKRLDLSFNCLQTLSGIEYFSSLEELILDNNLLDDTIRFFYNPFMKILSINKNKLTDLERFLNELSLKLPGLTYLSMLGNPACPDQLSSSEHDDTDYIRYRSYVLHRIPQLKFLDSSPVKNQERAEAQKRGHYYRLIRLNSDSEIEKNRSGSREDEYYVTRSQTTPLPFNEHTPKGAFGRLRHRYTGKHSEGNRFIRNHEL